MAQFSSKRQMNGTYGALWVNNELWADVEEFESTISANYEESNMAGDPATHQKMTGWSGEGTITVKKVYSRGKRLMADAIKNGQQPDITMIAKLEDPDAFGAERVAIKEVTFSEFTLLAFTQKELGTEELSFNFADFELIDTVEP